MGQFCLADGLFGSTARSMPHVVHFHSVQMNRLNKSMSKSEQYFLKYLQELFIKHMHSFQTGLGKAYSVPHNSDTEMSAL